MAAVVVVAEMAWVPTLQIRLSSPIVPTVGGRASTWAEGRADGRVWATRKIYLLGKVVLMIFECSSIIIATAIIFTLALFAVLHREWQMDT